MTGSGRVALVVALLSLTALQPAGAQLRIYRTDTEIGGEFKGSSTALGVQDNATRVYQSWATLGLTGFVRDPGFFQFRLKLRPVLGRTTVSGFEDTTPGTDRRLNYNVNASLFANSLLSLRGNAWHDDFFVRSPFGTVEDGVRGFWRAQLALGTPVLPMALEARRTNQEFVRSFSVGTESRVAEVISELRFRAKNRKMDLRVERVKRSDEVRGSESRLFRSIFNHRFRWGKGSQLRTHVTYSDFARPGSDIDNTNLYWIESAQLKHSRRVMSSYTLRLGRRAAGPDRSDDTYGRVTVTASPVAALTFKGFGESLSERSPLSSLSRKRLGTSVRTSLRLPAGARLRLGLGLKYEDSRIEATDEAWVPVVGERHVVEETRTFFLESALIDQQSVVLLSEDGATEYVRDFDYSLTPVDVLTRVEVLPTGRIQIGDRLSASYRFRRVPDSAREGTETEFNVDLQFRRFSAFVSGTRFDYSQTREAIPVLDVRDRDQLRAGLRYNSPTPIGSLALFADYELFDSSVDSDYEQVTIGLNLAHSLRPNLTGGIAVSNAWLTGESRPRRTINVSASLNWVPGSLLMLGGGFYYSDYHEDNIEFRQFDRGVIGGFVTGGVRFGLWKLDADYGLNSFDRPDVPRWLQSRVRLRLSRTF